MLPAAWAVVHDGKIELLEPLNLPNGTKVIVTVLVEGDEDRQFWLGASTATLDKIWNNDEDDIYADLLNA